MEFLTTSSAKEQFLLPLLNVSGTRSRTHAQRDKQSCCWFSLTPSDHQLVVLMQQCGNKGREEEGVNVNTNFCFFTRKFHSATLSKHEGNFS